MQEEKALVKRGRPPIYHDDLCTELLRLASEGKSDSQIYAKWGISKETFYHWRKEHEEFKEASEIAYELCQNYWQELGIKGMMNPKELDFKFWIAFMNRKFKWHRETEAGGNNTQININNINVLDTQSRENLITFIEANLKNTNIIDVEAITDGMQEDEGQETAKEVLDGSGK